WRALKGNGVGALCNRARGHLAFVARRAGARCGHGPAPLSTAFRSVDLAINHLKVGQSPKRQWSRPRRVSAFAPDPKQRDAIVHFGVPPQPSAALSAASTLEAP